MSYIPDRFRREIQLHLINNYSDCTKNTAPLILGIDGLPGDGKTFQCNEVLKELNCSIVSLSASDFGSMYEANASNYIVEKYREAADKINPVLVLNDIDTAIGEWSALTQYTANRQLVLNELMHLCDSPECPHDISSKRVPIIMTGNDFKKMYKPLIRFGRMNHFEWSPTKEEKLEIISEILYPLSEESCKEIYEYSEKAYRNVIRKGKNTKPTLVTKRNQIIKPNVMDEKQKTLQKQSLRVSLPISFYSQLRTEIVSVYLRKNLDKYGWTKTVYDIKNLKKDLYDIIADGFEDDCSEIIDIAKTLVEKYSLKSYI